MNILSLYSQADVALVRVSNVFANRVQLNLIKILATNQTLLKAHEFNIPGVTEVEVIEELGALEKMGFLKSTLIHQETGYSMYRERVEEAKNLFSNFLIELSNRD